MVKVSVVVPIYNVEKYLSRCVESLIHQTLEDMEIILVDDCSTDGSSSLCDEYAAKCNRIKVIHKTINEGLSEARNTGIRYASGEYIAFVDGDDYVELNTYEVCYQNAKVQNADNLTFGYFNDTPTGMVIHSKERYEGVHRGEEIMSKLFPLVIGTMPEEKEDYSVGFAPWGQIIRLEILKKNNILFVSERKLIYEDLMFALDLYPYINVSVIIKDALYHYVSNPTSLTMSVKQERYDRIKEMYMYLKNTEPYKHLLFSNENINLRFKRIMISYIRLCIMQLSSNKDYLWKIKEITSDEMCKEVLEGYPIYKLPIKQAVFAWLVKLRWNNILYFIVSKYIK